VTQFLMSLMHHYWYYKSTLFCVKLTDLLCFQRKCQWKINKASWKWHHQLLWYVRVHSAGTTYFSENYCKSMFSFHWISVLLTTGWSKKRHKV